MTSPSRTKEYMRKYAREYYRKNRKRLRAYNRERFRKNKKKLLRYHREWARSHRDSRRKTYMKYYRKNRAKVKAYNKSIQAERNAWRKRNSHRVPAWDAIHDAVESGKLIRPRKCSKCGKKCKPEGHHYKGYSKEHRLDVIWLCRLCHKDSHFR